MDYVTSKELSLKWGISQCRIILLAREGRIPGAKQYGKTWLFPQDATKPLDGRTKAAKTYSSGSFEASGAEASSAEAVKFRFPIYEYKDVESFDPPLSKNELTLKSFVESFNACRFDEAKELLDSLPKRIPNRYTRIHALYCSCMIDMMLCNTNQYLDNFRRLQAEFIEDFPHKEEFREFLYEIEATLGLDKYYSHDFNLKPTYHYHESFLPRMCNLEGCCLVLSETVNSPATLKACELSCRFLEKTDNYFDLQALHIYLGCAYAIAARTDERDYHFKKSFELAQKFDMFYILAVQYYHYRKDFDPTLDKYPAQFKNKVRQLSVDLHNRAVLFNNAMQYSNVYAALTTNDLVYLIYAMHGLSNKEVASRVHLSVGTVGKKYSDLYALLGVKNKKELIELYYSMTFSPS